MMIETVILKALARKNKPKLVKMPSWRKAYRRPRPDAIVAWEIYGNPKNLLSEGQTIAGLQSLERRGVVEVIVGCVSSVVWWALKH